MSLKGRNVASCMSTPDASTHRENEASLILSAGSRYLEKSHYKLIRPIVCNQWYFMLCAGNEWTARSFVSASCRFAVYHSNDLVCICCHSSRICKSFYVVIPRKSWSNRCWYCRHLYQVRKRACLASRLALSFVHLTLSLVRGGCKSESVFFLWRCVITRLHFQHFCIYHLWPSCSHSKCISHQAV